MALLQMQRLIVAAGIDTERRAGGCSLSYHLGGGDRLHLHDVTEDEARRLVVVLGEPDDTPGRPENVAWTKVATKGSFGVTVYDWPLVKP